MSKEKKNGKQNPGATALGCFSPYLFSQVLFPILSLKKRKKKRFSFQFGEKIFWCLQGENTQASQVFFFLPFLQPNTHKKSSLLFSLSLSLSLSKIHPTKYTLNVTLKKKTLFSQSLPFKATKRLPPYFVITHCFLSC